MSRPRLRFSRQEVNNAYKKAESTAEFARALGISCPTARRVLTDYDLPPIGGALFTINQFRRVYKSCKRVAQMAQKLACSVETVRKRIHQLGLTLPLDTRCLSDKVVLEIFKTVWGANTITGIAQVFKVSRPTVIRAVYRAIALLNQQPKSKRPFPLPTTIPTARVYNWLTCVFDESDVFSFSTEQLAQENHVRPEQIRSYVNQIRRHLKRKGHV